MGKVSEAENLNGKTLCDLSYFKFPGRQDNRPLYGDGDGSLGKASLFTQIPSLAEGKPVEFRLRETEQIGDGGLRLNYQPQNRTPVFVGNERESE